MKDVMVIVNNNTIALPITHPVPSLYLSVELFLSYSYVNSPTSNLLPGT